MSPRRGLARLALSLMLLWFVFWTFAYVIVSRRSENAPLEPAWSPTTKIALIAAAALAAPWIAAGFRAN